MPLYEYRCRACGVWEEGIRTVDERHVAPTCYHCKTPMHLIPSKPNVAVKNPAAGPKANWRNK